jgi:hypothetical protein
MNKFDYKKHKITEAQFDEMSVVEKRAYILQDHQEETMWWSRTANKILVISVIIGFLLVFWAMANNGKV